MFGSAEWSRDVPQSTFHFPKVIKKKSSSLKSSIKVELNNKQLKRKNKLTKLLQHPQIDIADYVNQDKHNSSDATTNAVNKKSVPLKKKWKNDKKKTNTSNVARSSANILDSDLEKLDETIIANKKNELFPAMKSSEVENMLFGNKTTGIRDKCEKQIPNVLDSNLMKTSSLKSFNKVELNDKQLKRKNKSAEVLKNTNAVKRSSATKKFEPLKKKCKSDVKKSIARNVELPSDNELEKLDETNKTKLSKKSEKIIPIVLDSNLKRSSITSSGASLRQRMVERLKAAQFRYLNEKLYLSEGKDAKELFKSDPNSFKIYHDGFRQQIKKWPLNPLEIIIKQIAKMPKETKVADMGCGEGELARRVPQKVRSFDLMSAAEGVEECDMAHTPLLAGEMDVAVYCLALMGTNLKEYLIEANRILKVGGTLKIAEVESRFKDINDFVKCVECYGFKVSRVDDKKQVFYFLDFRKIRDLGSKRNKLPLITLEPCLYKKR